MYSISLYCKNSISYNPGTIIPEITSRDDPAGVCANAVSLFCALEPKPSVMLKHILVAPRHTYKSLHPPSAEGEYAEAESGS